MPVPEVLSITAAASVLAAVAGLPAASGTAGAANLLLVVWVPLYLRTSAPINRRLTAAADTHEIPADARTWQRDWGWDWDRIIVPRAVLQSQPGRPRLNKLGVSLIS
jgi:hypothetical protein